MQQNNNHPAIRCLLICLTMGAVFPALAEGLDEGSWSGSYTPYHSDTLDVSYEVQYSQQEQLEQLSITMVIDLEPRSDFTYALEDVVISESNIIFSIRGAQESKRCELEIQDNGDYLGLCQSDLDAEGLHLTEIVMIPPPGE
jgi:hypothetical protein